MGKAMLAKQLCCTKETAAFSSDGGLQKALLPSDSAIPEYLSSIPNHCSGCLLHPKAWQVFQAILLLLSANLVGPMDCCTWMFMWELLGWAQAGENYSASELDIFLWGKMFSVLSSEFDWQIQHHMGNISPWQPSAGWWEKQILQNRETKASGKPHNAFFVCIYVKFVVRSHPLLQQ